MQPSVGTSQSLMKLLLKWLITENKSFHFTAIKLAAIKQASCICLYVLYKDEQVVYLLGILQTVYEALEDEWLFFLKRISTTFLVIFSLSSYTLVFLPVWSI